MRTLIGGWVSYPRSSEYQGKETLGRCGGYQKGTRPSQATNQTTDQRKLQGLIDPMIQHDKEQIYSTRLSFNMPRSIVLASIAVGVFLDGGLYPLIGPFWFIPGILCSKNGEGEAGPKEVESSDVDIEDEDVAAAEVMVESGEDADRVGMGWVGGEDEEVEGGDVALVLVVVGGGMEARVVVNFDQAQFGTSFERPPLRSRAA